MPDGVPAMVAAHLPDDEPARLDALRRLELLDTPPDERFERLVRVASTALGLPMAVVSLIDADRQWFKAEVGLGVRETPLASSFCAHALLQQDGMVVPDATRDPRFAANPLVTGDPRIRFYAGAVLRAPDGAAIGTLCVIDHAPRAMTEAERATLAALAATASAAIRHRAAARPAPAA